MDIKTILLFSNMSFLAAVLLDMIIGDPDVCFHPIRLIGRLIEILDRKLNNNSNISGESSLKKSDIKSGIHDRNNYYKGIILISLVIIISTLAAGLLILLSVNISIYLYVLVEALLICFAIAPKSLWEHSMRVYRALNSGDLEKAGYAVSMIVGRDTDKLDEEGIVKATVETVAENTSDGIVAPLFYAIIGGSIGAYFYKAVNTSDSMIGYKNEKYRDFGRAAARLDDLVNFIPSRLSAVLMLAASVILRLDCAGAYRCFKRDRLRHASPNSAQTESVCAGALGIRLAGDTWYGNKLIKKPYIGDDNRKAEAQDIKVCCRLMLVTSFLAVILFVAIKTALIICLL